MNVLIIEAEQWVSDWVSNLLPEATQTRVEDGLSALQVLTRIPGLPDVIILNADLPDIEGDLLLETIHADPRTTSLPVIGLCHTHTRCQRMQSAGAHAVLAIPFGILFLRHTLEAIISASLTSHNARQRHWDVTSYAEIAG